MTPEAQRRELHTAIFEIAEAQNHTRHATHPRTAQPEHQTHLREATKLRTTAAKRLRTVLSHLDP